MTLTYIGLFLTDQIARFCEKKKAQQINATIPGNRDHWWQLSET